MAKKIHMIHILFILLFFSRYALAFPAFPGAEGFGANSVGGRGGRIIKVTNLNDSGSGSFRKAVTASGPRIVVFDTSGIINLSSPIWIGNPYLTIAGQTSPGGILITGYGITIQAHDVIVQHMRFRVGSQQISNGANPETLDSLDIWGPGFGSPTGAYNIMIDHCSISWGVDETFTISAGATDITVQRCIISEGLAHAGHPKGEHSKGFLLSGKFGKQPVNVSFHHNYLAHNHDRNPRVSGPAVDGSVGPVFLDARNNVIYNWYHALTAESDLDAYVNWVENYFKPGPDSNPSSFEIRHDAGNVSPQAYLYVYHNFGAKNDGSDPTIWNVGIGYSTTNAESTAWRASSPRSAPYVTTSIMSNTYALAMLNDVGATKPMRDSVDTRVVHDFKNGTGAILDDVVYPDDFPNFSSPTPPTDADNDGMADSWETTHGLDTSSDDSALDKDGDGYTNIEEYLYFCADGVDNACGSDADCDDGNMCNGAETCQGSSCVVGTLLDCDDGNVCTSDSCDPVLGCQNNANDLPCSDGDDCTMNDRCSQGVCAGEPSDLDGDGHVVGDCGGDDCDDSDAGVHPGAQETCDDGIDQDCNGSDLSCDCEDADGDGHQDAACGGDDCDDTDANAYPGAQEICSDGIDQDCDGSDEICPGTGGGCGCGSGGAPRDILIFLVPVFGLAIRTSRRRPC